MMALIREWLDVCFAPVGGSSARQEEHRTLVEMSVEEPGGDGGGYRVRGEEDDELPSFVGETILVENGQSSVEGMGPYAQLCARNVLLLNVQEAGVPEACRGTNGQHCLSICSMEVGRFSLGVASCQV